ncbi:MAG TPA: VTT domain-containing protein [Terriglobales bacterium]|nr:VTT domain-containing protein [Terriglobales bacterium]
MHFLKHILSRYTVFVWGLLKPLGVWGAFGIAAVDAAFLGMPLDPVIAGYVYNDRSRFLLYAIMASAGSALGSLIVYAIGYSGGELLLRKRLSGERFDKIRSSFEKREFWALMIPSMLPPPAPFKLFVLSAGVFEMHFTHFLLAIFCGRMVRFLVLSVLTLFFGPHVVTIAGVLIHKHLAITLGSAVVVLLVIYVIYRLWRQPVVELEHELEKQG